MRVTMATASGHPGRGNEDFTAASPTAVVLVDGAGIPGSESTCRHGVAWYAGRLGGGLLGLLALGPERSLMAVLADAIEQVTDEHRKTCDVANPVSPSATVAALRVSGDFVEHLVLGDSVIVLDRVGDGPLVAADPREVVVSQHYEAAYGAAVGAEERDRVLRELRARRNQPGGFWVAKDDPGAADHAVTGQTPTSEVTRAALLSNGASRIVHRFGLADWPEVLGVLGSDGPAEVIRRVRVAEARGSVPTDDATIAFCTDLGPAEPGPAAP